MECTCSGRGKAARANAALILAALSLLVTTSGVAYAAGSGMLLGKPNEARKTTELTSKRGEPLALSAKDGSAPLRVDSSKVVAGLNADLVDGLNADDFAMADGVPPSLSGWTIMVAGSSCPAGSELVGIGGRYGAEDASAAGFGSFLYRVEYSSLLDDYRLVRDRGALPMSACRVD